MFAKSVTDSATARRLAYVINTLLGLEAIIKIVLMLRVTVAGDSELLLNPHRAKLNKSTQSLSLVCGVGVPSIALGIVDW